MASNGGTIPQTPLAGHHNCSHCGLFFESATSLQVHMHYHHDNINRWGPPVVTTASSTPTTPTDSDNNNQPSIKHHLKGNSPHHTIAAAADSSDNQPSTPQPPNIPEPGTPQSYGGVSPYQQPALIPPPSDMHYPSYIHSYDPYSPYHASGNLEYGNPLPPHHLNSSHHHHQQQQEYKTVPSNRFHPYNNNSNSNNSNNTVQISGLSPHIVSSSSATPNSAQITTTTASTSSSSSSPPQHNNSHIPPTPSPSPMQCDKCGLVCDTDEMLSEHSATAHQNQNSSQSGPPSSGGGPQSNEGNLNRSSSDESDIPNFHYNANPTPYIKEEPASDILDLDSQKMVYPHPDGPLPPMNSLHPLQSMQRHPMMWGHEAHGFMPPHPGQPDIKSAYYPMKNEYVQHPPPMHIKSEYGVSPVIPPPPTVTIKSEYGLPPVPMPASVPQNAKQFADEMTENQMTTSPSDFPSTTTPQENGSQYRSFEPPTSSVPVTNSSMSGKGTTWKSNEARRPKTYNCTACNKWFTSSGHLKRHYNTTLHKNAVKSSGQPDPATLPISVHHHPGRDPNHSGKGRRANTQHAQQQQQQPIQQPVPPPEPPRSPEYGTQYGLPGFQTPPLHQITTNQGFHQYNSNLHNPTSAVPPNGEAGPSVQASQPRGLLIYLNNNMETQQQQEMEHIITTTTSTMDSQQQDNNQAAITNTMEQFHIISPITINTSIPSFQTIQQHPEAQNYHHITGNNHQSHNNDGSYYLQHNNHQHLYENSNSCSSATESVTSLTCLSRYTGGVAMYQGDMAPPFSPDIPEQHYHQYNDGRSPTPQLAATAPHSPAPCSPSITSTGIPMQTEVRQVDVHRCIQCDKVFNKACYLTQHNKTFHSGEKPFKCHRCGKRFPCDQSHEEHLAKHGGDKPFKCELCPKQFNHKTDLRRHMCLHSGSKPYQCEQCGKGFIRKDHMLKHCDTHRKKTANQANKRINMNKMIASNKIHSTTMMAIDE